MEMNEVDLEKQRLRLMHTSPTTPSAPYAAVQQQLNTMKAAYPEEQSRRGDIIEYPREAEIYPRYEEPDNKAQQFRLQKINEVQKLLDAEKQKRASLAKKYQRGINVITGVSYVLEIAAVGLGAAGITLLSTVIAAPIVVMMEGVALAAGGLSVAGNLLCDKVLVAKTKKHDQIKMLAESKLNTIADHVSKALQDNVISDEEFTLIMSELDKYYTLRDEVKNKTKSKIDQNTKNSLIKQGKEQAVEEFRNMFGNLPKN